MRPARRDSRAGVQYRCVEFSQSRHPCPYYAAEV